MALNFDEIITRANARKDKLQEVQRLLRGWDQFEQNYEQAATYAATLKKALGALDDEGRFVLVGAGGKQDHLNAMFRVLSGLDYVWVNRHHEQTWNMAEVIVKRATE